jgi:O-acetyl-ADP-ribose deacetylase (regulator of RNase III)
MPTQWSNPSVLSLAGDADPITVITEKARDIVFAAREEGWEGPPFDPFELADRLGVQVVAVESLQEARLVHSGDQARIEFNPTRPPARVRFSVAHELGHLLFPDAGEEIRYRAHGESRRSDDWQVELLCNLAAAEFLMPIGGFPELEDEGLDINHLLALRSEYRVSTEALLLRVAKLTAQPGAIFAAARISPDSPEYRVDYAVSSRGWESPLQRGARISGAPISECTAVGFTAKDTASWDAGLHVECVGVPPYPGQTYPRVVGVLRPIGDTASRSPAITYVHGDATEPRGEGRRIIAHVVNDRTANWGGRGFAVALKSAQPQAQTEFQAWAKEQGLQLGTAQMTDLGDGLYSFSMVAQQGYGPGPETRLRYGALEECLRELGEIAAEMSATVHMPLIGTGQAGGDWATIKELIYAHVSDRGPEVTVYLLPGAPLPEHHERQMALPA